MTFSSDYPGTVSGQAPLHPTATKNPLITGEVETVKRRIQPTCAQGEG